MTAFNENKHKQENNFLLLELSHVISQVVNVNLLLGFELAPSGTAIPLSKTEIRNGENIIRQSGRAGGYLIDPGLATC
jgi:hypothetical protein